MTFRNILKSIPFAVLLVKLGRRVRIAAIDRFKGRFSKSYVGNVFEEIYVMKRWMVAGDSVSGDGSTIPATLGIRSCLPEVSRQLGIKALVDAPCGDFGWMREIVSCFDRYVGVDIVAELVTNNNRRFASDRVTFVLADITLDPLPAGDAVLCRDCFLNLPRALILKALRNFKKTGYRYIMLTHNEPVGKYVEIITGGCRAINWRLPPFKFPEPLETIPENTGDGRMIAIWETSSLDI